MTNRTLFACAAALVVLVGGCGSPLRQGEPAAAAEPVAGAVSPAGHQAEPPAAKQDVAGATDATQPARVQTQTITTTVPVAYATHTINDHALRKGVRKVRTKGVAGVRTLTYRVTFTNGRQTAKKLVKSEVTRKPVAKVVAIGTKEAQPPRKAGCDPNYSGACVPVASDVDCAGGSGNGPAYVEGPVHVIGSDIYDLDRDGDGIGCDA